MGGERTNERASEASEGQRVRVKGRRKITIVRCISGSETAAAHRERSPWGSLCAFLRGSLLLRLLLLPFLLLLFLAECTLRMHHGVSRVVNDARVFLPFLLLRLTEFRVHERNGPSWRWAVHPARQKFLLFWIYYIFVRFFVLSFSLSLILFFFVFLQINVFCYL